MAPTEALHRRAVLRAGLGALALPLVGCGSEEWYGKDVTGVLPDLDFTMTRASDGTTVSDAEYSGQVVALFFGYTYCPDICPMTLSNLSGVADALGDRADRLSILFVTVDPERDTREVLEGYVSSFTERADGLRGTPDQLARLTRRMKVTYRIADHDEGDEEYAVSHGKSVYLFGVGGAARVLWPGFDTLDADIEAATGDVRRLIEAA